MIISIKKFGCVISLAATASLLADSKEREFTGVIVLLARPSAQASLVSVFPMISPPETPLTSESGLAQLEQMWNSILFGVGLTMSLDDASQIDRKFVGAAAQIKNVNQSVPLLKNIIHAIEEVSPDLRIEPEIGLGANSVKRVANGLVAQIPAPAVRLSAGAKIDPKSWNAFTSVCAKAFAANPKERDRIDASAIDAHVFWNTVLPKSLTGSHQKIETVWYQPPLGIVCFEWRMRADDEPRSADMAAAITSLLVPATDLSGAIIINGDIIPERKAIEPK